MIGNCPVCEKEVDFYDGKNTCRHCKSEVLREAGFTIILKKRKLNYSRLMYANLGVFIILYQFFDVFAPDGMREIFTSDYYRQPLIEGMAKLSPVYIISPFFVDLRELMKASVTQRFDKEESVGYLYYILVKNRLHREDTGSKAALICSLFWVLLGFLFLMS